MFLILKDTVWAKDGDAKETFGDLFHSAHTDKNEANAELDRLNADNDKYQAACEEASKNTAEWRWANHSVLFEGCVSGLVDEEQHKKNREIVAAAEKKVADYNKKWRETHYPEILKEESLLNGVEKFVLVEVNPR